MDLTTIIYTLIGLIIGMTLHEAAHAFVSNWLGDETARSEGRLSLNPIVHIDPVLTVLIPLLILITSGGHAVFGAAKPVPFKPWALRYGKWGAAMVAAAGPVMNVIVAAIAALIFDVTAIAPALLLSIVVVNLSFAVFNLIPLPPLDGSRVLYAMVPYSVREVMDRIEQAGILPILLLLFIGFSIIQPFISAIVGWMAGILVPGLAI
jgi:Zn-dependent protease